VIKLLACMAKRPDLTDAQFHAHWAGPHRELALRITTLRRYVQSHRVAGEVPGFSSAPFDGVAEVWLDDLATAAGVAEDPDYTEHAALDEPNFQDQDRHTVVLATEQVFGGGAPMREHEGTVKAILMLRRAGGLGPQAFAERVSALGPRFAELMSGARRVSAAVCVGDAYADGAEPGFDAFLELSFDDVAAFERAWKAGGRQLVDEVDGVVAHAASCAMLVDELRVIWPDAA
jgi:uncharacterized protein (TIGR02118 family)